jgi:hypothetical protein
MTQERGVTLKGLSIRYLPDEVSRQTVADAEERGSNRNTVIVEIVARELGVPYEPSTARRHSDPEKTYVTIWMPLEVYEVLKARSARLVNSVGRKAGAMEEIVKRALCEHYGVRYEPPVRSRRRARPSSVAA